MNEIISLSRPQYHTEHMHHASMILLDYYYDYALPSRRRDFTDASRAGFLHALTSTDAICFIDTSAPAARRRFR